MTELTTDFLDIAVWLIVIIALVLWLSGPNLYVWKSQSGHSSRRCRTCDRERHIRDREARKP